MKRVLIVMLSTFNGERYLDWQLQSIYEQSTDCSIKLFVRDDGSSDSTGQILRKWESRIQIIYLRDGESLGAARSFWKLMEKAPDADYYAFVDQDDEWDAGKVAEALKAIGNTTEPVLWFSNCRIIDEKGKVIERKKHKKPPILTIPSQLICGSAQGCSMIFNRAAYKYVSGKAIPYVPMHDIVMMTYILAAGTVLYEDRPMFSYRVHQSNVVAKQGKGMIKKIGATMRLWFGKECRHSISSLAAQIAVDNLKYLDKDVEHYLYMLKNCKSSMKNKACLLTDDMTVSTNKRGLRSFKIRVALGLI